MTPEASALLTRLSRLCKRWGGSLTPLAREGYWEAGISEAPFQCGLGLHWKTRRLYYDPSWTTCCVQATGIIHEMGHVFACLSYPFAEELGFFGWEYALARKLGCVRSWVENNRGYVVGGSDGLEDSFEFGELSLAERRLFLRARLADATRSGLVREGAPLCIRPV